ncbi:sugar phosphate isomerase/epimerase family protein [Dyadobacter arcticus]|uniref:D-psicose/D-tagatose/L-ribulose 3-epimerase n=1 Tax=Dyadobacter arcticus TaxID=1078754 RepID=A0ABX0UKJ1_9BACT|nr:sugar phosphate isomerase/epimerase family protein [Dyadobacter arcticus]NIJ51651.1 D-psicose/D-tagatose/L-ribulose 3-epimerase [Dyadobacter arcticus]
MLFGASTFIWVSPFSTQNIDLLTKVKHMGYDIIEIAVEDTTIIDWDLIKSVASDLDLKITVSGAFGVERDISSTEPHYRELGKQYIIDCIKIAENVGSPIFGGPVYSAVGKTRIVSEEQKKQERAWCVNTLIEIGKIAEDHGVVVGLEPLNRFETDMINTVDQALSIVSEISSPNLKIVLDTFHSNIEEKDIPVSIRKIGKDLLCHVQGNESDRGTPGTGHLEWEGIRNALVEIGYDGAVVIETFGQPSKELAAAACIWRPLANSADELASEGLEFYKRLFS